MEACLVLRVVSERNGGAVECGVRRRREDAEQVDRGERAALPTHCPVARRIVALVHYARANFVLKWTTNFNPRMYN